MSQLNPEKQPEPTMKVWRPQGFAGVEVERADNFKNFNILPFMQQSHDCTVVHKSGEYLATYDRQPHRSKDGNIYMNQHAGALCSVEALDNTPVSVWTLRLYPEVMTKLKADLGLSKDFSYFPNMMAPSGLNDSLAKLTSKAILAFDKPSSHLERESKLSGLVRAVLTHCSDTPPPEMKLGREHKLVSLLKEVLHTHPEHEHTLDELATLTGFNKYYLAEVFKRDVGVPLGSYQMNLKVHKAKDLLAQGLPIAQVALEAGFADQSHLTRRFKTYTQVTPGMFQRLSMNS